MEKYNYWEAVERDVREAICEAVDQDMGYLDKGYEAVYDDLFMDDSVTGNASGSYTFNAWIAEEYIAHNLDLLGEAAREFGDDGEILTRGAEAADVTIRCYLLGDILWDIFDDLIEEYEGNED